MNLLARIERLERIAPKEDREARAAWLASLTDDELHKLIELTEKANGDLSVLTDAELDWLNAITRRHHDSELLRTSQTISRRGEIGQQVSAN